MVMLGLKSQYISFKCPIFCIFCFSFPTTDGFFNYYSDEIYLYPFCGLPMPDFTSLQIPSNQVSIKVSRTKKVPVTTERKLMLTMNHITKVRDLTPRTKWLVFN